MPPPMATQERQALRNMTDEQREAAEEYFNTGSYRAYLNKTSGRSASTAKPAATAGLNQKSAECAAADIDLEVIDVDGLYMGKSCNQARSQSRNFVELER
ncbi:hypothetical protein DOTSEDRAFT_20317 [Dothistroma septosporum NZE10]|uniref:Uncharacterized protein n=1 Tax=Dothistroma septosporum (strain NZE10 / CBS 128990) TaxID=675120 RepID=N1Q3V4_DOTSN|nr:hypothetical protein DOTSEDRAFT_20317 [Dothistroma septosporum NZE10]